ncbi:MAG: hypothetical protein GQ565_04700 [Candidatus Aegiribacteria sp.]|nr:hypothetical protein [Candidatus Aegiribacteria sp.]
MLLFLLSLQSFPDGPGAAGCACGAYAWSNDASSCLSAPAGLVRITKTQFSVYSTASDLDNNNIFAAAAFELGSQHYGAAAGLIRSESEPDTVQVALVAARTLKGDPVGFMEGVFGPSISIGASLGFAITDEDSEDCSEMLSAGLGFQFSVFPTIAIGVNVSNLRLAGDRLHERVIGYGFSTAFDRRFRGHFSVTNGKSALGFDLAVNDWLTVRTGSDGSSWNTGVSLEHAWLKLDWAVILNDHDCRQVLGISVSPGGYL